MSADRFSLYLDLEEGQSADLEVAARASIAFAETIREIAAFMDPLSSVRLELIDTSEGSIFLNLKAKLFGSEERKERTSIALFIAATVFIGGDIAHFGVEKAVQAAWERLAGADEARISDEDKKQIAQEAASLVVKTLEAKAGEKQAQRVYRELTLDPAVKAVGISKSPKEKPKNVVERKDFPSRGGLSTPKEQTAKKRTRVDIQKVVLISPVLVSGKRRWRFRSKEGEFGAPIKDENFVDSVLSGQLPIVMKSNVEMTVEVETTEEFKNGAWVVTQKEILRIIGVPIQFQGDQTLLPFNN
ncbi:MULTISPECIES: hypothetical protein [Methylobacterium]|jgi:hypothetical protein|uniref:Uncharacterized protein n=2 Tax=Methylobacterium TaxID=407 RepID=A0A0C6FBQ1_9HYPH|nr:hypothetical protein [Methylobacterium aquaticum]QRE77155.1 hypothetical protein F1D61_29700 [Methylobacterium aquaticum]BAQ45883.1 hypothetical protein Maq22A_c13315 [Methylobacterium aquaticum]